MIMMTMMMNIINGNDVGELEEKDEEVMMIMRMIINSSKGKVEGKYKFNLCRL